MARKITEHTAHATFTESFTMGADDVTLIMDGYEFADGEYFVTAALWNETTQAWVRVGTKRYENTFVASEAYITKYNLRYS